MDACVWGRESKRRAHQLTAAGKIAGVSRVSVRAATDRPVKHVLDRWSGAGGGEGGAGLYWLKDTNQTCSVTVCNEVSVQSNLYFSLIPSPDVILCNKIHKWFLVCCRNVFSSSVLKLSNQVGESACYSNNTNIFNVVLPFISECLCCQGKHWWSPERQTAQRRLYKDGGPWAGAGFGATLLYWYKLQYIYR